MSDPDNYGLPIELRVAVLMVEGVFVMLGVDVHFPVVPLEEADQCRK